MQNGDFGRLGPRLDLPGKKIGGGPKAQGVSKSGEFNTLGVLGKEVPGCVKKLR